VRGRRLGRVGWVGKERVSGQGKQGAGVGAYSSKMGGSLSVVLYLWFPFVHVHARAYLYPPPPP
jgi:hypothetical protein